MGGGWVAVPGDGFDVEAVNDPRTVLGECPSCASRVRLTERELVRNLKVLGVPLLATERAGRVFQCPRCDALCVREGDALPLGVGGAALDEARVEALTERVLQAEDEAALWSGRAVVAERSGEPELAEEMRAQAARSSRVSMLLRRELAALTGLRGNGSAADETAQGPVPAAAPTPPSEAAPASSEVPAPQEDTLESELAALRAKVESRRRPAPVTAAVPADDELATLKAKLGRGPATAAPAVEEPATEHPAPPGPAPAPSPAPSGDDDELAALKRNLRKKD